MNAFNNFLDRLVQFILMAFFFFFFFFMGVSTCKAKKPLLDNKLQEKDEKHIEKLLRENPKVKHIY